MPAGTLIPHIDPVEIVESSLNRMFVAVFNNEGARQHLGFARISPFHSNEGLPGWYLWFEGHAGAYGISIDDAAMLDRNSGRPIDTEQVAARIAVAYFPHPDEAVFDTFSWLERITLFSDAFDASGTPTLDARERLPRRHFTVGHIDLIMTGAGDLLSLGCTAADQWVDNRPAGLELIDPEGRPFQAVQAGARDRSVPGWSLAHSFLDKLVSALLHCQHSSVREVRGYTFEMPGFLIHADGRVERTSDRQLAGRSLLLIPDASPAPDAGGHSPAELLRSWQDGLNDTDYPETRTWTETWRATRPDEAQWGTGGWWQVGACHFHDHEAHLCACYTDR